MVFAGVGLVALPLDMIREFLGRPKSTIPKSEYIKRARGLGVRANGVRVCPLRARVHVSATHASTLSGCAGTLQLGLRHAPSSCSGLSAAWQVPPPVHWPACCGPRARLCRAALRCTCCSCLPAAQHRLPLLSCSGLPAADPQHGTAEPGLLPLSRS